MAIQLARAHPRIHLKLQDLPDRMLQAETEVWPKACPEAIAEKRIQFQAIDFFVDLPIAGCDVYYVSTLFRLKCADSLKSSKLKNILHAFSTSRCLTILKGIRKSMKPSSRVLIREFMIN